MEMEKLKRYIDFIESANKVKKEEQKAQLVANEKQNVIEKKATTEINSNYADLSLKRLADDIAWELEDESEFSI